MSNYLSFAVGVVWQRLSWSCLFVLLLNPRPHLEQVNFRKVLCSFSWRSLASGAMKIFSQCRQTCWPRSMSRAKLNSTAWAELVFRWRFKFSVLEGFFASFRRRFDVSNATSPWTFLMWRLQDCCCTNSCLQTWQVDWKEKIRIAQ